MKWIPIYITSTCAKKVSENVWKCENLNILIYGGKIDSLVKMHG
jgi:hypothetical protein